MSYTVHSLFLTVQGEGANLGRAAVFCRFAGCNLWSGLEQDRATATCRFCDTEFVGGTVYADAQALAAAIASTWTGGTAHRLVVFTGGEPLLQLDAALIQAVQALGFRTALETNGTLAPPPELDWVCVSPKAGTRLRAQTGDELKLVYPQPGIDPATLVDLPFAHYWLSPMDGPALAQNVALAAAYCLAHPEWRLAVQAHKAWNVA